MTDVFYITTDGNEYVERVKRITEAYWQDRDGVHPISHDSVWQDAERRKPARMMVIERVLPLFGSRMTHNDVALLLKEFEVGKSEFRKPTVNKRFWRQLAAIWEFLKTRGMPIAIGLAIVGVIIWSLFGEGGSLA